MKTWWVKKTYFRDIYKFYQLQTFGISFVYPRHPRNLKKIFQIVLKLAKKSKSGLKYISQQNLTRLNDLIYTSRVDYQQKFRFSFHIHCMKSRDDMVTNPLWERHEMWLIKARNISWQVEEHMLYIWLWPSAANSFITSIQREQRVRQTEKRAGLSQRRAWYVG